MKILVCVKMIHAFPLKGHGDGWVLRTHDLRMNAYDECACEEAVRIKEKFPAVETVALTVGPTYADSVVRKALEYGIDVGAHIVRPDGIRPDGLSTSRAIASFARDRKFDLLLFGVMSEDEERFTVGPATAAYLGIPCATAVIGVELDVEKKIVRAKRELEGGAAEKVELPMPCALTLQTGVNIPRYPNLTNKLRAKKQEIETIVADAASFAASGRVHSPPPGKRGLLIEGTSDEKAAKLAEIIRSKVGIR